MGPLISGKPRLVKYYSIWPDEILIGALEVKPTIFQDNPYLENSGHCNAQCPMVFFGKKRTSWTEPGGGLRDPYFMAYNAYSNTVIKHGNFGLRV